MNRPRVALLAVLAPLVLSSCDTVNDLLFLGRDDEDSILQGQRIPIMLTESGVAADEALADLDILLPPPRPNEEWPQAGGTPSHAVHHVALGDAPVPVWDADIGDGTGGRQILIAQPVVGGGRVFTIDSEGLVSAFTADTGDFVWEFEVLPEDEEEGELAGGLAYDEGRLYVTTGAAETVVLDAGTGEPIWRQRMKGPIRAAPTVYAGRVFVVTIGSQLQVLDARDGRELWAHEGIAELASILGYASPAAVGNTAIVVYPSGEIYAFRIDTGRELWNDSLIALRRVDAISSLSTIRGQPVIYDNQVYVIGHSGRMAAIDLRTGSRVWEHDFGGINTPWVAGDFIYVLTNDAELVAIARRNGGIKWVRRLPLYNDLEDREDPILWSGPVLAGDRLIVAGNNGIIASFSPYSNELIGTVDFDDDVSMPPVIANQTVYFVSDDGDLVAYR